MMSAEGCDTMKITILGSGTSTGVPMVGCHCPVCSSVDPKDKRTRASLMVQHNGRIILVDTSTDLRWQALREEINRIDAVLYTHGHADHVNGIDDLRGFHFLHKEIVPCYASRSTCGVLMSGFGYIFREHDGTGYHQLLALQEIQGPFELFGLTVTPIPLDHGRTESLGYRFGSCAYLTDCCGIPEASMALLQGLDIVIIDGLRWSSHPFHFNIEGAIAAVEPLKASRVVLTHLTHEVAHAEQAKLPPGFEFAYDGMAFELT